jgi:hypothetical protein
MTITYLGEKQLKRNLRKLTTVIGPKKYAQIVMRGVIAVENNSARRTPIKSGNLRDSGLGQIKVPGVEQDNSMVSKKRKGVHGILVADAAGAVGFTANTAEYAIYVHERTELNHITGEAKFLEKALQEEMPKLEKRFGKELKTEMFAKDMKS